MEARGVRGRSADAREANIASDYNRFPPKGEKRKAEFYVIVGPVLLAV